MIRPFFPTLLLCGIAAACASPEESFRADPGDGGTHFVYVAADYDLFPVRRAEGEAWRRQALRFHLAERGLCPDAYEVDDREEALVRGDFFNGDIYRVTYRGHCRGE